MEVVQNEIATAFTQSHNDIREVFKNKIVTLLTGGNMKMKAYGIGEEYCGTKEALSLQLDEKIEVEIILRTRD